MGRSSTNEAPAFRGRYEHAIDDKGRLSIPAKFREILNKRGQNGLVLADFDSCLAAYPIREWRQFEERIRSQSPFHREFRDFLRLFYSGAIETSLDNQGRVLIPPQLRDRAGLRREVVIVGVLNRIEIWSKERWEQFVAERAQTFEEVAAKLAELGI